MMASNAVLLRDRFSSESEETSSRAESRSVTRLVTVARALLVSTLMAAPLAFGAVNPWAWASLAVIAQFHQ